jgi:cell pole-organizing protein PopZ
MSEPRGTPETSMEEILASIRRIISEDGSPGAVPPSAPPPVATRPAPPLANPVQPPPVTTASPPAPVNVSISPPPSFQPVAPPPVDPGAALRPPSATTPPSSITPPSSTTPSAVWEILGDRQVGTGEELVLTQMVADDGSVVALDRPAEHAVPADAVESSKAQPLGVLLLTDALPEPAIPEIPAPAPSMPAAPPPAPKPIVPQAAPVPPPVVVLRPPAAAPAPPPRPPQAAKTASLPATAGGAPTLEDLVRQSLEPKIQDWLNANLKDMVERLVQQEIESIRRRSE